MADQPHFLDVRGVRLAFGAREILAGVDLAVPRGAVVSVFGKSGTGKSVFLKCLAGLLTPDAGEICFDGRLLRASDPLARAEFRRRCSYLFQHNALFDSLTALENVALPLEQTLRLPDHEIHGRAREALRRLELENHCDHFLCEMSGGMQKRLALARAIVTRPEIVLFDEPTAGLDPVRRNVVFEMIARYQREFNFTAVVVTHDVPEALVASDRVALLDEGCVHFQGTPDAFVASEDPVVRAFRDSASALRARISSLSTHANMFAEASA